MFTLLLALASAPSAQAGPAGPPLDADAPGIQLRPGLEAGFLGILSHKIQQDGNGTLFDLKNDGGQGTLFPFFRLTGDITLGGRHKINLLMQPLDLRSEVRLDDDLNVDTVLFPADSSVDIRYGFDFYRASWRYDLLKRRNQELSFGLGGQLRDADIIFTSGDGTVRTENRNVGPVPLVVGRFEHRWKDGYWLGVDASGMYANIKVVNGSTTNSVEGAIYDVSLRAGLDPRGPVDSWFNVRFFGGGSDGTSSNPDGPGDGYTRNWLHAVTFSLGLALDVHDTGPKRTAPDVSPQPPTVVDPPPRGPGPRPDGKRPPRKPPGR